MYRQEISQKTSPPINSHSESKDVNSSCNYGSLSSVVQRAQQDVNSISGDEKQQLESAIGTKATGEVLTGKQWVPEFKGISGQLWGDAAIQTKTKDDNSVSEMQPENKTGLPDKLKAGVENLSGMAMDDVKVHYNSSKPSGLGALAYTQGTDIHVAAGQEKHLPHEAWHVVQQKQGRVKPTMQIVKKRVNVNDDSGLEKEADIMSIKALEFHSNTINETAIQNQTVSNTTETIQRVVAITYGVNTASATITYADLGTGTAASVASNLIPSHAAALGVAVGAGHPYHHERGHLIGRQLGGDGSDVNNLVGLSDGTNAPLMSDIEGHVRDILTASGPGSSVWIQVTIDYNATHYAGPAAAPHVAGMVGMLSYDVYDTAGGALLYHTEYPNGVVRNHHIAGCC